MQTEQTKAFGRAVERELERVYATLDGQIYLCGITEQEAVEILGKLGGIDLADGFENWMAGE